MPYLILEHFGITKAKNLQISGIVWRKKNKKKFILLSRDNIINSSAALMYCPELNSEDLSKNKGKSLLDLMQQCFSFTNDVSKLDNFTSAVAMQMKAKNMLTKNSILTILYSRRYTLCLFCVNIIMEVLQLGQTQESTSTLESIATTSVNNILPKSEKRVHEINEVDINTEEISENVKATTISSSTVDPTQQRKCKFCGKLDSDTKFMICGTCKKANIITPYCSRECQTNDWKAGHKKQCGTMK